MIRITLAALAVAAFLAQALSISAQREQPRYDEVTYLSLARDYQREGGVVATIRCHLEQRCREDNRHPLFEFLLQPFTHDGAAFYADAKLVTIATALLLMLVAFLCARRAFSTEVALGTVVALSLLTMLAELSAGVLGDVLLAALVFAAVHAIGRCHEGGAWWWLAAGALIGLAWLTKGNGHLLLLTLAAVGLHRAGWRLPLSPLPYLAAAAFVAVAFFLLFRNALVFDGPFHNVNAKALWLDAWPELWTTQRSGEWPRLGLSWYLERHSLWDLIVRVAKGAAETASVFTYTAGVGASADVPGVGPLTAAVVAPRAATGFVALALAVWGMALRFRAGRRGEVLAVVYTTLFFGLAFSLGAQGVGEVGTRFVIPFVALFVPYTVYFLLEHALPWAARRARLEPRRLRAALAALLGAAVCAKLALFAGGFAASPRDHVRVPPAWSATSRWLASHLRPGERFVIAYNSVYSNFDQPFPLADARWPTTYESDAALLHQQMTAEPKRFLLLDLHDVDLPKYRDKVDAAPRDAHGPTSFLGWPRCFADPDTPSRFLVYCRPGAL